MEEIKKQHLDTYRSAILDTIQNNTNVLVEDILSLLRKPPLDSMDVLREKFFDCAKKNKIVIHTDSLNDLLEEYRNDFISCCDTIREIRFQQLSHIFSKYHPTDQEVFQFYKKDFLFINKELKKEIKDQMMNSFQNTILKKWDSLFDYGIDESVLMKYKEEIMKYYKGSYQKQILDNIDIKILVKDTTLMNSVKEHGDRYLYTLNHSRLLNDL